MADTRSASPRVVPKALLRERVPAMVVDVLVRSPNGGWAVATGADARAGADGALVLDANGAPSADDSTTEGARVRVTPNRILGAS